ncbi:hybrid sensor histidine kinase/response regulator [Sunxiuqinia indica]|uniref:hybrid sensor histidine kinase/response regulator n=1 Tax=Sunxiuqinia indica TaxID=2692584 RepID=UPI001358D18C|nr:hybrid sensor histidine kinase/response regulator [Sunxiuqinia indica]
MKPKSIKQRLHLIYLEDSPMDVAIVRDILEDEFELDFVSVATKKEFENQLTTSAGFDIILSDYELQGFDAREALGIAKSCCPDIPFICISGTIGEENAVELLRLGAVDYILKDRMARLVSSIKRAIQEEKEKKKLDFAQQEIKEQNKELLKAKQKAEESDRLKSVFLSNMSHEIRTPLNGILGFSELLVISNDFQKREKYASIIRESCQQLTQIIDSVLDISLIESNQIQLTKTDVDLQKTFSYVHTMLSPDFERKGIQLVQNDIPNTNYVLFTDERKLTQILLNLIKNGLKFTNEGYVEFGVDETEKSYVFYVRDTGIGIEDAERKVIFERFRQADEGSARNFGGAGLGLPISKSFVEILGGEIWFKSKPGKGSTFYFTIPKTQE